VKATRAGAFLAPASSVMASVTSSSSLSGLQVGRVEGATTPEKGVKAPFLPARKGPIADEKSAGFVFGAVKGFVACLDSGFLGFDRSLSDYLL